VFTLALVDRAGPLALQPNKLKLSEGENQNYLVPEIFQAGNYLEQSRGLFTQIHHGGGKDGIFFLFFLFLVIWKIEFIYFIVPACKGSAQNSQILFNWL